jgi:AMP-polyphosphate phosphotransferase
VEKVEKLTDPDKLKRAYDEINQFEAQLTNDGIQVIKIFLAITKDEQLKRFQARLADPYKQWKLTSEDIKARKKWDKYVEATDTLLQRTNTPNCSWHLIAANSKTLARTNVLKVVTEQLKVQESWMEKKAATFKKGHLREMLKKSP